MTSVLGHLTETDFDQNHRKWHSCPPSALFEASIVTSVKQDLRPIAENIAQQARYAKILFIWTDCDREGEHIGSEIRDQAKKGNARIDIRRAVFNNIERGHVIQAAQRASNLDELQANAVNARQELDLRIGSAFTRLQTLNLQKVHQALAEHTISYGSCQFPTLGFVVDRYFRVKNFVPEPFWSIKVMHKRAGKTVDFLWKRNHLFDRATVTILFEQCIMAKTAKVTKVQKKATSKWRPLPLTTVELQMQGSRFLRMDSAAIMRAAENLYNQGWISYPRTETDMFDEAIDLRALIGKQTQDATWGAYATNLLDNDGFNTPRRGRHNDKAHPPIHPVNYIVPSSLSNADERKIYEFIVRRFLGCCSKDAQGEATDIEILYGPETFHTHGLLVVARNYLDIYIYDKWESSTQLPPFELHESFAPTEANMTEGKTSAPNYLTEPELIALMDANGIGTDATMAEHIVKIKDRQYVVLHRLPGSRANSQPVFIPTKLGMALIKGYEAILSAPPTEGQDQGQGQRLDLSKPFLRKELELSLKAICEGRKTRAEVVRDNLEMWREVFARTQANLDVLKENVRRFVGGEGET